jgi:hypothetical protein
MRHSRLGKKQNSEQGGCSDWTIHVLTHEGWITRCGPQPSRVLDVPGIILEQERPNSPYRLVDFKTAEDFKREPIVKAGQGPTEF